MLDTQVIDLRGHIEPFKVEAGADVTIKLNEGDKELSVILSYCDLATITESVDIQIGIKEMEEELKLDRELNEDHVVLS